LYSEKGIDDMKRPALMAVVGSAVVLSGIACLAQSKNGGRPPSPYPFIFEQGPQGYMILLLGEKERAKVLEGSKGLMADLCSYRDFLCLNDTPH
jgi:hypothetical protein